MGAKITVEITPGEGLASKTSYQIDNGIKVIHAIQSLEHLLKWINEKVLEHGKSAGITKDTPISDIANYAENVMLEELF
jgi:hypothetical protein